MQTRRERARGGGEFAGTERGTKLSMQVSASAMEMGKCETLLASKGWVSLLAYQEHSRTIESVFRIQSQGGEKGWGTRWGGWQWQFLGNYALHRAERDLGRTIRGDSLSHLRRKAGIRLGTTST